MNNFSSINFQSEIKNEDETFLQMKSYIKNLEQVISKQQNEIKLLKMSNSNYEKDKIKNTSLLNLKENNLRDTTLILENLKFKNKILESKNSELEKENVEINDFNAELKQKNRILMNSQFYGQNKNSQYINLINELNEVSVIKSKLEFEIKNLQNKINEITIQYENEIKLITKMKNEEIIEKNKIISEFEKELNSLNLKNNFINESENKDKNNNENNSNNNIQYSEMIMNDINELQNKTTILSNENNELKNILNNVINKNKELENLLISKDKIINELKEKNKRITEEMKLQNEQFNLKLNLEDNNLTEIDEAKNKVNQLLIEREDLIKENTNLKNIYGQFNNDIKEANDLFNDKVKLFENVLITKSKKIKELQGKINLLNEEKNNLNQENNKLKSEKTKLEKNIGNEFSMLRGSKNNNNNNNNFISRNNQFDFQNQGSTFLKSGNRNINFNIIEDPFADSQQKSIEEFKQMLNKVDENLNKGKEKYFITEE